VHVCELQVLELLRQVPSVQTVIALTKCDKDGVDVDTATTRIAAELQKHGVFVEVRLACDTAMQCCHLIIIDCICSTVC
jgi:hypothetical protein